MYINSTQDKKNLDKYIDILSTMDKDSNLKEEWLDKLRTKDVKIRNYKNDLKRRKNKLRELKMKRKNLEVDTNTDSDLSHENASSLHKYVDKQSLKQKHLMLSRQVDRLTEESEILDKSIDDYNHKIEALEFKLSELQDIDTKVWNSISNVSK